MKELTNVFIRPLNEAEPIPYELLLLADPSRNLVENYLKHSEIYVAILDDKIIGTFVLYPISSDVVEIKNISVEDEYQERGLGTVMLKNACDHARAKGFSTICIGTGNSSVGQLYLYQKVGFEIASLKKNFFIDNYPEPLYENGIQVKHMIMLARHL